MSLTLKALGLGFLAAMALSAGAVMNASAGGGGHFVSDIAHTEIKGTEEWTHHQHIALHGFSGEIGCNTASYSATTTSTTVTSLTVTPNYANCFTTGESEAIVPITMNGCQYTLTVASKTTNNTTQTSHLICPIGKKIEVHHPNCTITIWPQWFTSGLKYTTTTENGKHIITVDSNIRFNLERHGLCAIFGVTGIGTINGSATVRGFDTVGNQVNVTAT